MSQHVLVVFEYGSINGGENSFLAVVDRLRELDWRFSALVPPDTDLQAVLRDRSVATLPFRLHDDTSGLRLTQDEIRNQIRAAIQHCQPDLVHCNSLSASRLCGPVCRQLNQPSIGYLRDIMKLSRKAIDDINQLDRIVAVSDATRDFHIAQGISNELATTIYNGVDANSLLNNCQGSQQDIRGELQLRQESRLLLFVGQIGLRKGIDTLLQALRQLHDSSTVEADLHLLIVGQRHSVKQESIDYENNLHEYVATSGLSNNVHWLGRRSNVPRIMSQCTALVHPARQEPLGRVLLEAAAIGLPIVATRVGGTEEILCHPDLDPFLVAKDDSDALAKAVQLLLSDENLQKQTSARLRAIAANTFTVSECVRKLDHCYREIHA